MALLQTLTDPFNTTTIDTSKWFVTQAGSATLTGDSSGLTCNFPASSTSATDGDISGQVTYDFTNSYAYIQTLAMPSGATNADALLELTQGGGTGNYVRWVYEAGTLYAQWAVAYAPTTLFSVPYNATTHKWWRIREGTGAGAGGTAGTIYFDTSSNGSTWSNLASCATTTVSGGVTALLPLIGGTCYKAETNPGTFKWNNFNIIPSAVTSHNLALLGVGA